MNNNEILYRNDDAFGDGYRAAADVLAYEIFELGNLDSLHFMFRNYALPREIRRKWCGYVREILGNGYVDDMSEDELIAETREILNAVENSTGKKINFVLWLTDRDSVKQFYEGTDENIDGYDVGDAVLLSDLGFDGKLYGFAENPTPIPA